MNKGRKYYTLLVLDNGKWAPQFGDYDAEVVEDEQDEYEGQKTKVIRTDDTQAAIDAKVAALNAKR